MFKLTHVDLYDALVDTFGRPRDVQSGGAEFIMNCFKCPGGDTGGHLAVNMNTGHFHCWKCDYRGLDAVTLFEDYNGSNPTFQLNVAPEEALKKKPERRYDREILPKEYEYLLDTKYVKEPSIVQQKALAYALSRTTEDNIRKHQIGFCGRGNYQNMLIIPVIEEGRIIYFTGRSFLGRTVKKNPDETECGIGKSEVVFNIETARKTKRAVVSEGAFDAMRIGVSGVAIFGTSISKAQKYQLTDGNFSDIIVMLDRDARKKAQAMARDLYSASAGHFKVRIAYLEKGDPAEHSTEELRPIINEALLWGNSPYLKMLHARFLSS